MALVLVLVAGISVSCGSPPDESQNVAHSAYTQEFEDARHSAQSEFVRKVLAAGKISDLEFTESQSGLLSCLRERAGEPDVSIVNGFTQVTGYPKSDDGSCSEEWDGQISELFNQIKTNPDNANFSDLVAACLVRIGIAPPGFTGHDFDEMVNRSSEIRSGCVFLDELDENGDPKMICDSVKPVEDPNPAFPSGALLVSEETEPCRTNPLGTGLK